MEVSVRELKSRLSEYLRRAGGGEDVIVTSHGREVARLIAPPRRQTVAVDERELLARIRDIPGVRPGVDDGSPLPKPLVIPLRKGEKTLTQLLLEEREQGW